MQLSSLLCLVAVANSVLSNPILTLETTDRTPAHALLPRMETLSEVRCETPCQKCGTSTINISDLEKAKAKINAGSQYCVDSDGSTRADADKNWALVGECGDNNAAIWLQSYVKEKWCLPGYVIDDAVRTITSRCSRELQSDNIFGWAKISDKEQWVEVGHSQACNKGSVIDPNDIPHDAPDGRGAPTWFLRNYKCADIPYSGRPEDYSKLWTQFCNLLKYDISRDTWEVSLIVHNFACQQEGNAEYTVCTVIMNITFYVANMILQIGNRKQCADIFTQLFQQCHVKGGSAEITYGIETGFVATTVRVEDKGAVCVPKGREVCKVIDFL